ncbi:MAG: nitronate monooxygenase [Hyphomicrobiales bacterium]|nr:nitronate monooxygenase [Hyphomicrobiales bacterium]
MTDLTQSPVCRLLGIRYPILQGGMTLVGNWRLASAVSAGGGLGVVSAGRMDTATFRREIAMALDATDQPVGVNIPIGRQHDWIRACFEVAIDSGIKIVLMGGGDPKPWCPLVKDAGKLLGIVTATPEQAAKAEAAGADLVVAESIEAGGRTSRDELAGVTLIPAAAERVSVPLVAAGGFVDGRGLAAALCLGADGVQMGTRFMLAEESPVHEKTRRAMVESGITDTMVVGARHRMGRRVLRSAAAENVQRCEPEASLEEMIDLLSGEWSLRGLHEGDTVRGMVACGQGVGLIHDVLPAAEIIANIMGEAATHLARAADLVRAADGAPAPDA